jgi:DNA-binding IclR family transcriptional regulator
MLRHLSSQPTPVAATRLADVAGVPRSTAYHLLAAMAAEDFVVHYPEDRSWGLGMAAWEIGSAFAQQAPLGRLARVPLARLADHVGQSAHLAVLHGNDVLYVLEERAPGRPPLVSDVGVRLPAHLTASGRAILASLPPAQVRALYPSKESFSTRTGLGPTTPSELRRVLVEARQRGFAIERDEVTTGFTSVGVVVGHSGVRASVAITWDSRREVPLAPFVSAARGAAALIASRLGGSGAAAG